jgi:hypothetical protein
MDGGVARIEFGLAECTGCLEQRVRDLESS